LLSALAGNRIDLFNLNAASSGLSSARLSSTKLNSINNSPLDPNESDCGEASIEHNGQVIAESGAVWRRWTHSLGGPFAFAFAAPFAFVFAFEFEFELDSGEFEFPF